MEKHPLIASHGDVDRTVDVIEAKFAGDRRNDHAGEPYGQESDGANVVRSVVVVRELAQAHRDEHLDEIASPRLSQSLAR